MHCEPTEITATLKAGPGLAAWSAARDAVHDALVDAGKCWATGAAPHGGRGWREALEPAVQPYLGHTYPELREAALRTLGVYWALPAYRAVALHLSREDPDPDVRATALGAWAGYYGRTGDRDAARELAARLRDPNQPAAVRAVAYRGLLDVLGHLEQVDAAHVSQLLDVFEDVDGRVDWRLVDRLLNEMEVTA